ncbi:ADAMTS-like protein 3 [Sitophilus oryzae]|uniref:ADAMTS-like protein 3 n=1 Tax=Sitophilus oryzae TaxID=7048 RepID=A0A6J2X993_SITOR|nr:ADAMTS-like protein 3 [Sitophilus oryzae]
MSEARILYTIIILCSFVIYRQSIAIRVDKSLSPIQLNYEKSEESVLSKGKESSGLGKVVESGVIEKAVKETNYDSLDDIQYADDSDADQRSLLRGKKNIKEWDHWGKWSPCSATCGVGKTTRWRHCVSQGCASGEKEAQIRTCTLKPCP